MSLILSSSLISTCSYTNNVKAPLFFIPQTSLLHPHCNILGEPLSANKRSMDLKHKSSLEVITRQSTNSHFEFAGDDNFMEDDWKDQEDVDDLDSPWEGAILYQRNPSITHLEYCTTLERLGLGHISSEVSKSRASLMGLRVTKSVKDFPHGTPVLISIDVSRKKQNLKLDGIIRTVITLGCNRASMAPKYETEKDAFACYVFEVNPPHSVHSVSKKVRKGFRVVKQENSEGRKVTISGEMDPDKFHKCLARLERWKYIKPGSFQAGECSINLKKKEAAPKTNNNNNNQDMGPIYPCYYNNGYGGYDNGYGYGYGYGFPYPTFGASNNYATYNDNSLECGGHAADCASHHQEKRDHSSTKKPADDHKSSSKPEKASSVSFNKLGVHGHKEKKGCTIM